VRLRTGPSAIGRLWGHVLTQVATVFEMSSLVVFSVNVRRLAAFYEAVLGANPRHEPSGDIRLIGDREEVLVHSIPAKTAKTIEVRTPPEPREGSAMKPVFDVESLEAAMEQVNAKGGVVTARTFSIDGLTRHDVIDPDGNVIQLRGRSS
jgi:predicted enzyme related to lactoylglutathione lyase